MNRFTVTMTLTSGGVIPPFAIHARLVLRHPELADLHTTAVSRHPEAAGVYFPALLRVRNHPSHQHDVRLLALNYLQAEAISLESLGDWRNELIEALIVRAPEILASIPPDAEPAWFHENEDYRGGELGVLVDLTSRLGDDRVDPVIARVMDSADPYLVTTAISATFERGGEPPAELIERLASDSRTWTAIHRVVNYYRRTELIPANFMTQEVIAEAHVVDWLTFPTELGAPPAEIEHMATVRDTIDGISGETYLFRYRSDGDPVWYAANSAIYLSKDTPTTEWYSSAFSRFEPWDSNTPDGHAKAAREVLAEWCRDFAGEGS